MVIGVGKLSSLELLILKKHRVSCFHTLANLAGAEQIRPADILETIQYRSLDRKLFS